MSDYNEINKIDKYNNKINLEMINNIFDKETIDKIKNMITELSYFQESINQKNIKYILNMSCEGYLKIVIGDTEYLFEKYNDTILEKNNMFDIYLYDEIIININKHDGKLNLLNENYNNLIKTHIILGFIYHNNRLSKKLRMLGISSLSPFVKAFVDIVQLNCNKEGNKENNKEDNKEENVDDKDKEDDNIIIIKTDDECSNLY